MASSSFSSAAPATHKLGFKDGCATGSLQTWLLAGKNRARIINLDVAEQVFGQTSFDLPAIPAEPMAPVPRAPDPDNPVTSAEEKQLRHALSTYKALTDIRTDALKKRSYYASVLVLLQEGLTDDFKTRLGARDAVAGALESSNPMVYLREIIVVANGLGQGSHIVQLKSVIDSLHSFIHNADGKNTLGSEQVLGTLMERAVNVFATLKESPALLAQSKVFLYINNLKPSSFPKTRESLLHFGLTTSTLAQLPSTIPAAREMADLLDPRKSSAPPAAPEAPKVSGSARGRAPTGGHVEDEDDGGGGSYEDPGRQCTKCPAGSKASRNHTTEEHRDKRDSSARDAGAVPAKKHRRHDSSKQQDRGRKQGRDKESTIDLQGQAAPKSSKPKNSSVRLQQSLDATDMPADPSRSKCFSLKNSSVVVQSLDCGTMVPATNDLSALTDVREVNTPVTTLGGNIVFRKSGKHREFGCETVYDASVGIELFNFVHLEQEYSLTQLHMRTVGVDGSTGLEKNIVTGFSFTREGVSDPDGPSVLRRLTFTREESGVNKHLFVRDRSADVYTRGSAKKSGSVRARDDDDDSAYSLGSDSEDSDSDDASISSDGYSSGAASDSDGGGGSN